MDTRIRRRLICYELATSHQHQHRNYFVKIKDTLDQVSEDGHFTRELDWWARYWSCPGSCIPAKFFIPLFPAWMKLTVDCELLRPVLRIKRCSHNIQQHNNYNNLRQLKHKQTHKIHSEYSLYCCLSSSWCIDVWWIKIAVLLWLVHKGWLAGLLIEELNAECNSLSILQCCWIIAISFSHFAHCWPHTRVQSQHVIVDKMTLQVLQNRLWQI